MEEYRCTVGVGLDIVMSKEELFRQYTDRCKPSIFLAGPTSRTKTFNVSWRKDACEYLRSHLGFKGVVFVPENRVYITTVEDKDTILRYENPNEFSGEELEKQHWWEWKAIDTASRIIFWIPRDVEGGMPAFTTNVEFGRYIEKYPERVWLGYPENAEKMDYLEHLYKIKNPERKSYRDLHELLDAVYESFKTEL